MTQKIRIKRSELDKLSDEDLRALANNLFKIEEANKNRKADYYLERMTRVQEEMHKSNARFICCWAGNRCLRGDQRIFTRRGLVAIRDIQENDQVLSFDQAANQFRYNRSSAAIPKGSDRLVRVVHEKGEFVAHELHQILQGDGKYQYVRDLQVGSHIYQSSCNGGSLDSLYPEQRASEQNPSYLSEYGRIDLKKSSNFLDDCPSDSRLYGQQPNLLLKGNLLFAARQICAVLFCAFCLFLNFFSRLCNRAQHEYSHIHSSQERSFLQFLGTGFWVFLGRSLSYIGGLLSRGFLKFLQSSLSLKLHRIGFLQAQPFLVYSSFSQILSIEKLEEPQDYYDIQVNIDHNYITEDGAIHHNSGKSTGAIMELRWRVLGDHPFKKCKIPIKALLICTDFENHVNKVIEPKIKEWFPPNELAKAVITRNQNKAIKQIRFQNGSIIDVLSHDQDPMIFESSDADLAVFDEPPPHQIFKAVWRGLTDRGGNAIIAGTPIVQAWNIQEYKKWQAGNPDGLSRHFIIGSTEENAANLGDGDAELGRKRIAEFAAMLSPEEREARLNGQPLELQGLVFKAWNRSTHLVKPFEWPSEWPIIESIDPHPRKPAGCSWIGLAPNGSKILLSSGYLEGDVVELAEEILRYRESLSIKDGRRPRIIRTLIDNSANVPLTGRSISNVVRDRVTVREELEDIIGPRGAGGPRIEAPPKNVTGKIESLRAWLTVRERDGRVRPDFFVMDVPENEDFLNEIEGYVWAKYKNKERAGYKDQPVKKDDDILDSVLQVALTYKGQEEKEGEIAKIFKSKDTYSSRGAFNGR